MPTDAKPRGKFFYSPLPQQEGHGEFLLRLLFTGLCVWETAGFAWQPIANGTAMVWYEDLCFVGNAPQLGQAGRVDLWDYQLDHLLASLEHLLPAELGQVESFELHDDDKCYLINVLRAERIVYFQWEVPIEITHFPLGEWDENDQPKTIYSFTDDGVIYHAYEPPVPFWKFWQRQSNKVRT